MQDQDAGKVVLGEAEQIQDMRVALKAAAQRVADAGWSATPASEAYSLGKLHEALEGAEQVLFHVLNTAATYCDCGASARVIREGWAR